MLRFVALAMSASILMFAGCGDSGPKRYLVGGEVTFKKAPVKLGTISFRSEAGHTGMAQIIEGKYELPKEVGLPEGKYRVAITYPDPKVPPPDPNAMPGETPPNRELIPSKYNSQSTLTAEVKPAENKDINFNLD